MKHSRMKRIVKASVYCESGFDDVEKKSSDLIFDSRVKLPFNFIRE